MPLTSKFLSYPMKGFGKIGQNARLKMGKLEIIEHNKNYLNDLAWK
jgi:hypothetical protein